MIYNKLGQTNLNVSLVGLGGIPVQRISKQEVVEIMAAAKDVGINFFDTANGYSVSEEYFGYAMKEVGRDFIIATKSGEKTKEGIMNHVDLSLKRLQVEKIDLYQFHNVRDEKSVEEILGKNGAYEGLLEAQKQGKIVHIGGTFHTLKAMEAFLEKGKLSSVMFPYNIVERQGEKKFEDCFKSNVGVIAMKPFAGGNIEKANLAMKFILQNPFVTTAIPGMASVKEVLENSQVALEPLNSQEEADIEKVKESLTGNFCRRCDYCKPCKQGIDIAVCQTYANYVAKYDLREWTMGRYLAMEKRAKDCISCKECEQRCPYGIKISEKMKEISKIFGE